MPIPLQQRTGIGESYRAVKKAAIVYHQIVGWGRLDISVYFAPS